MLETLAIFSCSLQCCFFGFSFFWQRKADLYVGGFIFTHSTHWPPQKAMKSHLFLSLDCFTRCLPKIKRKAVKTFDGQKSHN
jgi:hypothetical protein